MILLACDPGLGATAFVVFDAERDGVLHRETWRYGPECGEDAKRISEYCARLRSLLVGAAWRDPIDALIIEDQKTSLVAPGASEGPSGGRALPPAVQAAVDAAGAGGGAKRGAVAARGSKNANMIRLAKLAGALEQVAMDFDLRVIRVSPEDAKRALTADPNATKPQMRQWARMQYPTRNEHEDDCMGICKAGQAVLKREAWEREAENAGAV